MQILKKVPVKHPHHKIRPFNPHLVVRMFRSTTVSTTRSTSTGSTGGSATDPASTASLTLDLSREQWIVLRPPWIPGGRTTGGLAGGHTSRSKSRKDTEPKARRTAKRMERRLRVKLHREERRPACRQVSWGDDDGDDYRSKFQYTLFIFHSLFPSSVALICHQDLAMIFGGLITVQNLIQHIRDSYCGEGVDSGGQSIQLPEPLCHSLSPVMNPGIVFLQ